MPTYFARVLPLYAAADNAIALTQNVQLAHLLESKYQQEKMNVLLLEGMEQGIKITPYNDLTKCGLCRWNLFAKQCLVAVKSMP